MSDPPKTRRNRVVPLGFVAVSVVAVAAWALSPGGASAPKTLVAATGSAPSGASAITAPTTTAPTTTEPGSTTTAPTTTAPSTTVGSTTTATPTTTTVVATTTTAPATARPPLTTTTSTALSQPPAPAQAQPAQTSGVTNQASPGPAQGPGYCDSSPPGKPPVCVPATAPPLPYPTCTPSQLALTFVTDKLAYTATDPITFTSTLTNTSANSCVLNSSDPTSDGFCGPNIDIRDANGVTVQKLNENELPIAGPKDYNCGDTSPTVMTAGQVATGEQTWDPPHLACPDGTCRYYQAQPTVPDGTYQANEDWPDGIGNSPTVTFTLTGQPNPAQTVVPPPP